LLDLRKICDSPYLIIDFGIRLRNCLNESKCYDKSADKSDDEKLCCLIDCMYEGRGFLKDKIDSKLLFETFERSFKDNTNGWEDWKGLIEKAIDLCVADSKEC